MVTIRSPVGCKYRHVLHAKNVEIQKVLRIFATPSVRTADPRAMSGRTILATIRVVSSIRISSGNHRYGSDAQDLQLTDRLGPPLLSGHPGGCLKPAPPVGPALGQVDTPVLSGSYIRSDIYFIFSTDSTSCLSVRSSTQRPRASW